MGCCLLLWCPKNSVTGNEEIHHYAEHSKETHQRVRKQIIYCSIKSTVTSSKSQKTLLSLEIIIRDQEDYRKQLWWMTENLSLGRRKTSPEQPARHNTRQQLGVGKTSILESSIKTYSSGPTCCGRTRRRSTLCRMTDKIKEEERNFRSIKSNLMSWVCKSVYWSCMGVYGCHWSLSSCIQWCFWWQKQQQEEVWNVQRCMMIYS